MAAPVNRLKAALAEGGVAKGPFLSLGSPAVAEIAGRAGYDYVLIDGEHTPFDPVGIAGQIRALEATGTPVAVRVPGHDAWLLKQVLDLGAQTVMVPMVDTAAEAEAVVAACLYPPEGRRGLGGYLMRASGYGTVADYPGTANAQVFLIVQIETRRALSNIEAIAAVPGVDALFIGPADLGCDMGLGNDPGSETLWQAVGEGVSRIARTGRIAGVFAGPDRAEAMIAAGARLLGTGSDSDLLTRAMRSHAKEMS